nr:anoctamin-4-like [Onthophagus taurus]
MAKIEDNVKYPADVKAPADFILVYKKNKSDATLFQNSEFFKNLKQAGLILEPVDGVKYTDCVFVKITASDASLEHLATVHGLYATYHRDRSIPQYSKMFSIFKSKISLKPKFDDPMFLRCSNSVRGQENTTFTSAERITLISYVLDRTKYGGLQDEYGLGNLLATKNFDDAFPLHDGPAKWSETGILNDRQILAKYWGNWIRFYQFQPIHIIYKYYGSDIAFFFAWLEFFSKLLVIPTFLGLFAFGWAYVDLNIADRTIKRVKEVCSSTVQICPPCTHQHCVYANLSDYCGLAMTTYYVDNNYTVFLAIAVTIWATIFLELWSRQEIIWQYKWNLNKSIPHIDEMANYKVRVHNYLKYNKHTKTETHYTPFYMKSERILISILGVIGGVIIVILTTATIVISEHFISYYILKYRIKIAVDHLLLLLRCYGYFVTIVLMRIYSPYLAKLAKVLTDQEIHRTKTEYLNAYILKSYTLAFFNSYIMTFYNCFVKESMYTNPGDYKIFHKYFGIGAVLCPPSMGCYGRIFLMTVFSILKSYILMFFYKSYLVELLIMGVKHLYKIIYEEITLNYDRGPELPQWEEEYSLKPISSIFFANAFTKRILEYGLLTFYSATVPVLPGLVLLNNIVELRLTAMSLIRHSRRNVPKRVLGLGSWNNVLQFVTRLSYLISVNFILLFALRQF